jgi:hypothetical protein
MSISDSLVGRDAAGRFLPGQSGNPVGKAPGTRNRATRLRQLIEDGEERVIGRVLIDKAKAGDAVAARFVIGHLMPRPRSRAIELDLPEGTWAGDIVASFNATMMAMASGEITPDEALTITRTFDGRLKALKAYEMERHLTRWEPIPGDTAFEEEVDEVDEEEEEEDAASTEARPEPSPSGRGQGEGVAPAKDLHSEDLDCGGHPHPDPLPEEEGASMAPTGPLPANDQHLDVIAPPAPPPAPLHSACIEPSPATIAGRRRVAEQALRQWMRTMPR